MILPCPRCGKDDFKKSHDRTNHLNRKNKCKPKAILEVQIHEPVPVIEPVVVPSSSQKETTHLSIDDLANWLAKPEIKNNPTITNKKLPKTDAEWFDLMEKSTSKQQKKTKVSQPEEDPEAGPGPKTQTHREGKHSEVERQDTQDIIFKECSVGRDLERPHKNQSSMSKWVGIVPSTDNPAYAFNIPIDDIEKYAEIPYIPQLISTSQHKIKEVLQTELCRKDQIKSAIVALCLYSITKRNPDGTRDTSYTDKHHRGGMHPILSEGDIDEHITKSIGKIDKQVEETLKKGSGYVLERILEISIESYTYRRANGGSYIHTPKKLANTNYKVHNQFR
jgi:hypothetical protein